MRRIVLKKLTSQFPAQQLATVVVVFLSLMGNASAIDHRTQIIKADVVNVEPIYMSYTLQKISTPCQSGVRGCWNVSYQKKAAKILKGYRVKLSYNDSTFTARMAKKPQNESLDIRVKSDLLSMPSTVAINAAVVY